MKDIVEIKRKQKEVIERLRKRSNDIVSKVGVESLKIDFRCSATERGFTVFFEREHGDKLYKVIKIVTDDRVSHLDPDLLSTSKATDGDININEIECSNINCPYCRVGREWSFIRCGCGKLSCAGGLKEYGSRYIHYCP